MPDLVTTFGLSESAVGHLTSAVQFGFIIGTLVFAILSIADRFSPSKVFFSCAVLGALLAWVTTRLQGHYSTLTIVFRTLAGVMLVAMGMYIAGWWLGLTRLEQYGHKIWKPIQRLTQPLTRNNNQLGTLTLGLSWGFLPCGLIYSTLIWCSSIAQTSTESALLMFTFGLGTLPAMIIVGNGGQLMRHYMQRRAIRSILGIIVILMGVWTLSVPLQHLGHHQHGNTEQPSEGQMDPHAHHH